MYELYKELDNKAYSMLDAVCPGAHVFQGRSKSKGDAVCLYVCMYICSRAHTYAFCLKVCLSQHEAATK